MAVCLTGHVSVLCVCLCECVSGTHMKLCCWLNLQMRGQQPCPSACAETPGGLQQLGRTILGGTGLYWAVLGSSGQAGGDSRSSHPVAGTFLLCKQGFQADAQWLVGQLAGWCGDAAGADASGGAVCLHSSSGSVPTCAGSCFWCPWVHWRV